MTQSTESIRRFVAQDSETLLFASLSPASLEELLAIAESVTVPPETTFIVQGESGDSASGLETSLFC